MVGVSLSLVSHQDPHRDEVALGDVIGSEIDGFDHEVRQGHDFKVDFSLRAAGLVAHGQEHRVEPDRWWRDLDHVAREVHGGPRAVG